MSKKFFILTLLVCFTLSAPPQADSQEKEKKDKSELDEYFIEKDYFRKGRPSIDLSYGLTETKLKNSGLSFERNGIIEMKLGFKYYGKSPYGNILRFRNSYLYGSLMSYELDIKSKTSGASALRFGIGSSTGYGYRLGKSSSLIFYNSGSIVWTRYDGGLLIELFTTDPNENKYIRLISDFNKTFRFGTGTEAGIIIPIEGIVNFQIQYDRTLVFPRHLVWKHLGSMILEGIGQAAIDGFVRAIMKSTPAAGPIVSFILKNGLSYGLYELRREKMNWPFNSAKPLLFDSFKLGLTFTF